MWDNVQSAGHHCKINPDRVTPTQGIHNLHLIPSWHLNWKRIFVHLGELSGFDRDESSWPCSVGYTVVYPLLVVWQIYLQDTVGHRLSARLYFVLSLSLGGNEKNVSKPDLWLVYTALLRLPHTVHSTLSHSAHQTSLPMPQPLCALLPSDGTRKSTMRVCAYLCMFVCLFFRFLNILFRFIQSRHADIVIIGTNI